jgi:hypothetical protein
LTVRKAFTYTTLDIDVAPPQPIRIIAKVASEMTNLALSQMYGRFAARKRAYPMNPNGVGLANRFRRSPSLFNLGVRYSWQVSIPWNCGLMPGFGPSQKVLEKS